jgi:hypothetical protein
MLESVPSLTYMTSFSTQLPVLDFVAFSPLFPPCCICQTKIHVPLYNRYIRSSGFGFVAPTFDESLSMLRKKVILKVWKGEGIKDAG